MRYDLQADCREHHLYFRAPRSPSLSARDEERASSFPPGEFCGAVRISLYFNLYGDYPLVTCNLGDFYFELG